MRLEETLPIPQRPSEVIGDMARYIDDLNFFLDSLVKLVAGDMKTIISPIGGILVPMINDTGANTIKGTLVEASTATEYAFSVADADTNHAVGAVFQDGIADGEICLIAVSGIVDVLLEDSSSSTLGYWVRTSTTQAGRADATNSSATSAHWMEIGHTLQTVTAGTDKLCRIIMHFN